MKWNFVITQVVVRSQMEAKDTWFSMPKIKGLPKQAWY